jgi:hypothetical protein
LEHFFDDKSPELLWHMLDPEQLPVCHTLLVSRNFATAPQPQVIEQDIDPAWVLPKSLINWKEWEMRTDCTGNKVAEPCVLFKTCGGLTFLEQKAMRVFEQRQAALQELRTALGRAVWVDLLVKLEDFAQVIELHTPQEINQYMEELKHAA